MSQRMSFDLGYGPKGATPREPDAPMRLLVIGDFSGRAPADRPPLATRPTLRVDLDTLDTVFSKLAPRVTTASAGEIALASPDDFHPDALLAKLELFRALRTARTQAPPSAAPANGSSTNDSPLAALLGGTLAGVGASAPKTAGDAIDALIRKVIAPHIVPDRQHETKAYVAAVDSAIAEQMRLVLHDAAFQSREAAWRGVQWLVSNLELDETLQLHLFDVSRDELLADLAAAGAKLSQTGLYAALADRGRKQPGGLGWSALIGLDRFGSSDTDIGLLAALGLIGSQAGGPFIAAGDPALAEGAANWNALRASEVGRWIGLVAPRLLLRRPYGARDEKCETFAFEELGNTPAHEQYLWGSGALACALALGRGYRSAEGWEFSPGEFGGIDDLPSATRLDRDGEKELVPSAEHFLADTQAEKLLDAGLMPLLSHRHQNAAMLMRWQSIAQPKAALAGLPE